MKYPYIKLEINKLADKSSIELVKRYWNFEFGKFSESSSKIKDELNISFKELNNIIQQNSTATLVTEKCVECNNEIEYIINTQSYAKPKIEQEIYLCPIHKNEYYSKLKELDHFENLNFKLEYAFKIKIWTKLTKYEFNILREIIKLKTYSKIYENIYKGDKKYKQNWPIIEKLARLGLIEIRRDYDTNRIKIFYFLSSLKKELIIENNEISNNNSPNFRIGSEPKKIDELISRFCD